MKELGSIGLERYAGHVYEEFLTELRGARGRKVIRQMADNDATIGSLLFAVEMLARQVTWNIAPANDSPEAEAAAQFVRECLFEDMNATWPDTLSEILSFLPFGWSYFEIVYKVRGGQTAQAERASKFTDGRIGWRKWAIRSQESLDRWEFDDAGDVTGMTQRPAPTFLPVTVPIEKALLFRTTSRKGNPEGFSILRRAYVSWYYKTNVQRIEGIGIERDLAGLPVAYVPPEILSTAADANEQAILASIKEIVTNIRRDEQEGVVFPLSYDDAGKERYRLELLNTGGARQFDAQPLDAKILTPQGWKCMGEMKVGDEIICPLGHPSKVLGVFPKGKRPVYRLTLVDGRSTTADARHKWVVTDTKWKSRGVVENSHPLLPQYRVIRTEDITARYEKKTNGRLLHIPLMQAAQFKNKEELKLHPYVLGVLLGDGILSEKGGAKFHTADSSIAEEVRELLPEGDVLTFWEDSSSGAANMYRITGTEGRRESQTKHYLDELGLVGKDSSTKFIPDSYLWASAEDRLALLQGLMDTDGTIAKDGQTVFCTSNSKLVDGVLHIVRSLGGTARVCSFPVTSYRSPKDGQSHDIDSIHYRVTICLPSEMLAFRLSRKIDRVRERSFGYHTGIQSIEYVGEMDVQCILVSSPSHMYVTDDFIPTHNTDKIITRYDQRILMSVLADFLLLGHEKVGSFALSNNKTSLFSVALGAWLDSICAVINQYAIPRLMTLNAIPLEIAPKLTHGDVEEWSLTELAEYVSKLAGAGVPFNTPEVITHFYEKAKFPVPAEGFEDILEMQREAAEAQQEANGQPEDDTEDDSEDDQPE